MTTRSRSLEQQIARSLARQRTELLPGGLYLFEDQLEIGGQLSSVVITCQAWLLELYSLRAGQLSFTCDGQTIHPQTRSFGVFYAPFSICQPCFINAEGKVIGIAATIALPANLNNGSVVFEVAQTKAPKGFSEVLEILGSGTGHQLVELNSKPSLLSLKTKRVIDETYLEPKPVGLIAADLGVTPEHLCRQFKADFGLSPTNYLRRLRLADAPLRLAQGEKIVNVSQAVGYNDLSRFYKQFRRTTDTSPGICKQVLRAGRK